MISEFRSRAFVAFLLTGGTAALVNFGSRVVLSQWLTFPVAVVLAYLIGMVTAFILAKLFVFSGGRQSIHRSAALFVLVNAVAVLQTWGISMLLAYYVLPGIGIRSFVNEIAHGVGVVVPVFTSFLGHKRWSFR